MRNKAVLIRKIKKASKKLLKKILLSKVFHSAFRVAVIVVVVMLSLSVVYSLIDQKLSNNVIVSESEIVSRVSRLVTLPSEAPISIMRVSDANTLMNQNQFYKDVKEGDYVLAYKNMIILYDLREDKIVAMY